MFTIISRQNLIDDKMFQILKKYANKLMLHDISLLHLANGWILNAAAD